jgi:hypothetical protein
MSRMNIRFSRCRCREIKSAGFEQCSNQAKRPYCRSWRAVFGICLLSANRPVERANREQSQGGLLLESQRWLSMLSAPFRELARCELMTGSRASTGQHISQIIACRCSADYSQSDAEVRRTRTAWWLVPAEIDRIARMSSCSVTISGVVETVRSMDGLRQRHQWVAWRVPDVSRRDHFP